MCERMKTPGAISYCLLLARALHARQTSRIFRESKTRTSQCGQSCCWGHHHRDSANLRRDWARSDPSPWLRTVTRTICNPATYFHGVVRHSTRGQVALNRGCVALWSPSCHRMYIWVVRRRMGRIQNGSQQTPQTCEIVTLARYARTFSAVKGLLYDMSGIDRWLLEDACYRGCDCAANVACAAPVPDQAS